MLHQLDRKERTMMWGYGGWGMIFMGLFWLGVVALVIWGIKSKGTREMAMIR